MKKERIHDRRQSRVSRGRWPMNCDAHGVSWEAGLTVLGKTLLLKHMRIRRVQMRESVGVRYRATGAGGTSARGHPAHHGARLTDLRPARSGNTRMHLLYHSGSRVSSVWVLAGHWVVARGHAVLRHALMGGKRLRHHHCERETAPTEDFRNSQPRQRREEATEGGGGR